MSDTKQKFIDAVVKGIAELPDRSSPEGLMRGGDYWIVRGARVYAGGTIDLRDPDATHYQIALPRQAAA